LTASAVSESPKKMTLSPFLRVMVAVAGSSSAPRAAGSSAAARRTVRTERCRRTIACASTSLSVSGSVLPSPDGERTVDAGPVALPVIHRDDEFTPRQLGDGPGQLQLPDAPAERPELLRQVLAGRDAVDGEVGEGAEAVHVQAGAVVVHADQDARQFLVRPR